MICQNPGCSGRILDGYCDICGLPSANGQPVAVASPGRDWQVDATAPNTEIGLGYAFVTPAPPVDAERAVVDYAHFDPPPTLVPGTLVANQYRVIGCLARGGMGWIYLASDERVQGRLVVLKGVLTGSADEKLSATLEQRYLAQVNHPNIVEIYNVATHQDLTFIVMEYVGGRSLAQYQKELAERTGSSALPFDDALALVIAVLPAIAHLHRQGLIYCDFKPANVIQVGDCVKLIDLGSVRRGADSDEPIFGTPSFQAPEAATTGPTVATEIYAIGKTLQVLTDGQSGNPVAVTAMRNLIGRCCAPAAADRFSSVAGLRDQAIAVLKLICGRVAPAAPTFFAPPEQVSFSVTSAQLPHPLGGGGSWGDAYLAGLTAFDQGDHVTAERAFFEVASFFPGEPGPLLALAYAQVASRPEAAIDIFSQLAKHPEPWQSSALIGLALAYRSIGQLGQAVKTCAAFPQTSPVFDVAQYYRCQWLIDAATNAAETEIAIPNAFRLEWRLLLERAALEKRLMFVPKDRTTKRRLSEIEDLWGVIARWNG